MLNRKVIESSSDLSEAVKAVFGKDIRSRTCILTDEAMSGSVAEGYDALGRNARMGTYQGIVRDFMRRTGCPYGSSNGSSGDGLILEVACGSGLLSLELAKQTGMEVLGVDMSSDMIRLAKKNLADEQSSSAPDSASRLSLGFEQGSAYNLSDVLEDNTARYIVCRNALHRFQSPESALKEMYSSLAPGGMLYIRDLKRDADWTTIIQRIGEERWQRPELVVDYIGAMAGMLKTSELKSMLRRCGIEDFEIAGGHFPQCYGKEKQSQLEEYSKDVEYVCLVRKHYAY